MSMSTAGRLLRDKLVDSEVLTPDSAGYKDHLKRWNAAIEKDAPIVVVAGSSADVSTTLKIRNQLDLDLAVVGGGHFAGAASVTDSGILLSLARMNKVTINAQNRTAAVQGGALAGAVTRAAGEHQLAAVAGNVSNVGFVGLSLCGGYGHLTGQFGLMADNILSAEVVLADGTVVTASPSEYPDLFWALRGAGPMMGVVTMLTIQLHQLRTPHNLVFAGSIWFQPSQAHEVLQVVNRIVPDPTGRANLLLVLAAPPPTLAPMLLASIFYDGSADDAKDFFKDLYALKHTMEFGGPMPYDVSGTLVDFTAALGQRQTMGCAVYQPPMGSESLKWVADKFVKFTEDNADKCVSAEVVFEFHQLDAVRAGGLLERGVGSVFPHRGLSQNVMVCASNLHAADDASAKGFVDEVTRYLRDRAGLSSDGSDSKIHGGDQGIYTGYDSNRSSAAQVFGPERVKQLKLLKAEYDPNNVFNKWYPLDGEGDL